MDPMPFERPDPRVLYVWLFSSLMTYGIIALGFFGAGLFFSAMGRPKAWLFVAALAPLVLLGLTVLLLKRTWANWGFRVTPKTLEMRHGVVWRNHRVVGRNRIQHIDINSGPLDRRFGLVQVVVYTAGTTVGMIPGLRPERAEQLRLQLSAAMETKPGL